MPNNRLLAWFRHEAIQRQRLPESIFSDDDSILVERLRLAEGDYLKRAAALLFHPDPQKFFSGAFVKIGYFSLRHVPQTAVRNRLPFTKFSAE